MHTALIEPLESRIAPAVFNILPPNPAAAEEGSELGASHSVTFTIELVLDPEEVLTEAVTVDFHTVNETATSGSDYLGTSAPQTVTFQPGGALTQVVNVTILEDQDFELDETFRVELSNPQGPNVSIGIGSATATILNDDPAPVITVTGESVLEGNATSAQALFTLSLDKIVSVPVSVRVRTVDGTAIAGQDYTSFDGIITFAPGEGTKQVLIDILGDTTEEQDETVILELSDAENAVLETTQATATIRDDDATGEVKISVADVQRLESDGVMIFNVTLSRTSDQQITVKFATVNGTAIAGQDYTANNGTLTFEPGELVKTVAVAITPDTIHEPATETFLLRLSDPVNAVLDRDEATGTIIDDDPAPVLTIVGPDGLTTTLDEGDSTQVRQLTIRLDRASYEPITIRLTTQDGTAFAGTDYIAIDQVITFAVGETSKQVAFTVLGDTIDELDQTLTLTATLQAGTVTLPAEPVTVTLRNDDRRLTVSDMTLTEGDEGTTELVFTVALNAPSDHVIIFTYQTVDGTATSIGPNADYVAHPLTTVTFEPGELQKEIRVVINNDLLGEPDEFFRIDFTSVQHALINKTSVRGTILDNDPFLSISDARVVEGAPGTSREMVFTVTLLRAGSLGTVTMQYQTANGTATAGEDYIAIAPTPLSFAPGETTKTISVTVLGDADGEADETFLLTLSNFSPELAAAVGSGSLSGTGTIIDDEGLVVASDAFLVEGDSGTANMIFVLTLIRGTVTGAVKVNYSTEDGTAISTGPLADYIATSGSVTFAPGTTQQTIAVPIRGDLLHEGNQTFKLNLSVDNTGITDVKQQASVATTQVIGTIIDNDPEPRLTISGGSVVEGAAGAQIVFTVNLIGGAETDITVHFATQSGTATAGVDFTPVSQVLTFAPGETVKTVAVPVLDDAIAEVNETFTAVLSNPVGATITTATATGTIIDDDVIVTLDALDFLGTVLEGNSGKTLRQMRVTLSQAAPAAVTVTFAVTPGSATAGLDYELVNSSTTLTFAPGETEKFIGFNIIGETLHEADETFAVALTGATNATLGASTNFTATIVNDDAAPSISIEDAQVTEGDSGTKAMTFTVRLSGPSGRAISVLATPMEGSAKKVADFIDTAQTISFAAGETTKTFTVNIVGDTVDEPTETFTVELSNPTGGATIARGTATGTIFDNDARTLSISDARIAEGDSGQQVLTFTVTLSQAAFQVVTIDYATANGTATADTDYVAATGTLQFLPAREDPDNPGSMLPAETSKTITILINGDTDVEPDETFFVRLRPNAAEPVNALIVRGEAVGTIQNDETQFVLDTATAVSGVEEGPTSGTANTLTFKILRLGDASQAASVNYETVNGTAKAGSDFVAKSGTLNFAAGETMKTVTVQLVDDLNFEADETFKLRLSGAVNAIVGAAFEQEATILGSDVRPSVQINDSSVIEGNDPSAGKPMTFTVQLRSGGVLAANEVETITVNYMTIAGTARDAASGVFMADFNPVTAGVLTFAPGETSKTITITIKGDTVDENDETFMVQITSAFANTSPEPTPITITRGTAIGTIIDDDDAPIINFLQVPGAAANGDITVAEGSSGNFTITPTLQLIVAPGGTQTHSEKDIAVTVTTVPGTATLGSDFLAPNGTVWTVVIPAGTKTFQLPYTIIGDTIDELDETFTIALSNPQNVRIGDAFATVTITDDDPAPQLVINNASIVEGDSGLSNMIFNVFLLGASDRTVTVNFTTIDGTGTNGATSKGALPDFVATSGTLSFAPGETMKTIAVPIYGDTWAEADETFTVTLSGEVNATILTATATGTIFNGGDTTVGLVVQDARSVENPLDSNNNPIPNPTINFRVELTKVVDFDVSFTAATRNGTAVAGSDFTALNQGFTILAGQIAVTVPVGLKGDTTFEATESFFLGIGGISGGVAEARGEGRGVILNDDFAFVDAQTLVYVDEDGDLATLRITKGDLRFATITLGPVNQTTGGRTLQLLDFTRSPAQFNGTDVRITVSPQSGFAASGLTTDGRVDVGFIRGAIPDPNTLRFVNGIDFGSIVIPGDLGKITAGDLFISPAIRGVIDVASLGARGTATGAPDNVSEFLSIVNAIKVKGDVRGVIKVIGDNFGSINSLKIGGALRGDAAPASGSEQSGIVFFTGTLKQATIGSIIGGKNPDSGKINGNTSFVARIGTLHVLGDIVGGEGVRSGHVVARTIGSVVVDGSVIGGGVAGNLTGTDGSPIMSNSGMIFATQSLANVKIGGDVKGGIQSGSGWILSSGTMGTVRIGGSLIGGTGSVDTGVITANQALSNLAIAGDIVGASGGRSGSVQVGGSIAMLTLGTAGGPGGNLRGGSGEDSGTISAGAGFRNGQFVVEGGNIGSALIHGSIIGGTGDGSATRTGNGSGGVQAGNQIAKLEVRGSLIGGSSPAGGEGTTAREMTQSGFVLAGRLGQMIIGGDLVSGTDGGAGLADSGVIRVHENIGSLAIQGNVIGNETSRVVISAGNNGPVVNGVITPAIATLTIGKKAANGTVTGGNVSFLEVLAGYAERGTTDNPRGEARSADAQIGTVTLRGNVLATNIVAGGDAGVDGVFGTADDAKLEGDFLSPVIDSAKVLSSIAKVIVGGQVLENDGFFGIVAERVASVIIGGASFPLAPGAGNDFSEIENTKWVVNELTA